MFRTMQYVPCSYCFFLVLTGAENKLLNLEEEHIYKTKATDVPRPRKEKIDSFAIAEG